MSEQVTYTRDGQSTELQMEFTAPMEGGTADAVGICKSADVFLFKQKITPLVSDRITRGQLTYAVVVPLPGFSCWGYADVAQTQLRVHLKQLNK